MQNRVSAAELSRALNISKTTILKTAKMQGWPFFKQGNSCMFVEQYLPGDVRFALVQYRSKTSQPAVPKQTFAPANDNNPILQASEKQLSTAQYRAALIYEYSKSGINATEFISAYNSGVFASLYKKLGTVSTATFYRWLKEFKENGSAGLVPHTGSSRGGAGQSLTDEERDLLRYFWLRPEQPSVTHAWRLMKANLPYSRCTQQTARNYLNSLPKPTAGLYRMGEGRFENTFLPYMEQNMEGKKSLEVVVSDHHCLDCVVMYRGKLIRPWLTTFQDYRSGRIIGYCPCVKPSSLSITVAFYMACIRFGVPQTLLFDNGKDYRSKYLNGHTEKITVLTPEGITEEKEVEFTGMFYMVGVKEVHFTRTYNGKSKGSTERTFRTYGEYIAKEMGSYVGSDSRSRPEEAALMWRSINGKAQRNDVIEWTDFIQRLSAMIELINDTFESDGKANKGKTRTQVFIENLPENILHADKELLQKALCKGSVRKVGRNGVKVNGVNFYHPALHEFFGRQVRVYESLQNDREVMCCSLAGEFICNAIGDYFAETGRLSADIARLEYERKTLTSIAIEGANEVAVAPEYKTMVDVAMRAYASDELTGVDRFLSIDSPGHTDEENGNQNLKAVNALNSLPPKKEAEPKLKLINPLLKDD